MVRRLRQLLGVGGETPGMPDVPGGPRPVSRPYAGTPVRPRVLLVIHNPVIEAEGGRKLSEVLGWFDPDTQARRYIADIRTASGGYVDYQIVERIERDAWPVKVDGFRYDDASYLRAWRARSGFHQPDAIDYPRLLESFKVIERVNSNQIDEAWFFAFPYSGDWESTMAGPGAFWCNSPPIPGTGHARKRFVVMGFSYERDVDCMLENFGHRTESIMSELFRRNPHTPDLWELFCRYDIIAPGRSQCGNVHFAPSSERDYDWGNPRSVLSACDDWYDFPGLAGRFRRVDRGEWGGGDMRLHHLWWLDHLPRVEGEIAGIANNWWQYILDPARV